MTTRMLTCSKCGDKDYADHFGRIDDRLYCHACYEDAWDKIHNEIIGEATRKGTT